MWASVNTNTTNYVAKLIKTLRAENDDKNKSSKLNYELKNEELKKHPELGSFPISFSNFLLRASTALTTDQRRVVQI